MYTAEIDFQTEKERVQLTQDEFSTPEEASAFVIDFIKPYIEGNSLAEGEWKVFDPEHPEFILRQFRIQSIRSLRASLK
jgi:hypothetical protein